MNPQESAALIRELGLTGMSREEEDAFILQFAEAVQNRVALRLGDMLTPHQLDHFNHLVETKGEEDALRYLERTAPQYPLIVREEIEALKTELSREAADILELTQRDGRPTEEGE